METMDAVRLRVRYMALLAVIPLVALVLPHRHHHHRHRPHAFLTLSRCADAPVRVITRSGPSEIERIYRADRATERGTYDAYRRPR